MTKPASLALAISTIAITGAVIALTHAPAVSAKADPAPNTEAYYTQKVQPILRDNCYRCHGAPNHRGGLTLDTRAGMLKGGHDGTVLVPGDPANSLLIKLIRHEGPADDPMPMPPRGKLSDEDIAVVTAWVKAGAVMPKDSE